MSTQLFSFRFGVRHRKVWLVVHIAAAGTWLGLDVVLAVLVFTALGTDDPATAAFCFRALEIAAIWPLVLTGLVALASGVMLGLGTKYGLLRYWWVLVKLVANVVLVVLVAILLRPGLHEAADIGRAIADGRPAPAIPSGVVFPPIVSTSAVLVALVLSVFKPWGRIRPGRPATGAASTTVPAPGSSAAVASARAARDSTSAPQRDRIGV